MNEWLLGITCAAMLAAVARCLMPNGAVRQVGSLVCAMLLVWAVLRPLGSMLHSIGTFEIDARAWQTQEKLEEKEGQLLKSLIEQECGTYIVDKAARLGANCQAEVVCVESEEGVWLPDRCTISGQLTSRQQSELQQIVAEELGIVPQKQRYTGGE